MSEKMRFAIIGGGVIAPSHARAIIGSPNAELVAVADIDMDKGNKLAAEFSVPHVYTSYEEMLKRDDISNEVKYSQPLALRLPLLQTITKCCCLFSSLTRSVNIGLMECS
jgi:hypothetical protein